MGSWANLWIVWRQRSLETLRMIDSLCYLQLNSGTLRPGQMTMWSAEETNSKVDLLRKNLHCAICSLDETIAYRWSFLQSDEFRGNCLSDGSRAELRSLSLSLELFDSWESSPGRVSWMGQRDFNLTRQIRFGLFVRRFPWNSDVSIYWKLIHQNLRRRCLHFSAILWLPYLARAVLSISKCSKF